MVERVKIGLVSSRHRKPGDVHVASVVSGRLVSFQRANGKSANGQRCHCGNITRVESGVEEPEQFGLGGDISNRREWMNLG